LLGEDIIDREEEIEVSEGEGYKKVELDSDQGASFCRNFLVCVERLYEILQIAPVNKEYRLKFSKAYRVLYNQHQDNQLCFLPEILDSAQEAFPFLWVNGEKYVFSKDVLDHGKSLFKQFCVIRRFMARFVRKIQ
jgi:hypothetical protein